MRVISGEAKGHSLKRPKETSVRPTTDLMREAIFSALESLPVDWSHTLDLYAGTGSLGIEALSRGSKEVDFVDHNPKCCDIIRENLRLIGFDQQAHVHRLDARKALHTLKKQYGLIFMDPPYSEQPDLTALAEIASSNIVGKQTTIVMEHSRKLKPETKYGNYQLIKNLCHGDTWVSIYQHVGGAA